MFLSIIQSPQSYFCPYKTAIHTVNSQYNAISKRFMSQKALVRQNSQYNVILICFCRCEALFLYKIPIYWDYVICRMLNF